MASRDVNQLIEPFRTSVKELVKRAKAQGIPILVTETTRTIEEQRENVKKGYSKTMNSKHLTGEAVDIAFQVNGKLSYDPKLYKRLYEITKTLDYVIWPNLDLKWNWDWPHHQYDKNKKVSYNEDMYKELYEQEKKDHKESIKEKELNYKNWQKELDGRKFFETQSKENYDRWQSEIEARHKVETERDNYRRGITQNASIIERIKILVGM